MQIWIFNIISPVFGVTWSLINQKSICLFAAQETYMYIETDIHWYLCLNITTSTTLIDQIPGGVIECYYIKLSVSLCVYRMTVTV